MSLLNEASLHEPRLLLGPGPSPLHPRVLSALSRPPIGYLDPELFALLDEIYAGLRRLFQTKNRFTLPLTGTGMAGMEFCLTNLLEPGDTAVIGVNGFFGGRMCEIAERHGANVVRVDFPWGETVDTDRMIQAIQTAGQVALVGCVHAETSTGVRSDCRTIAQAAHDAGALFVLDAVTSLGGLPVAVDEWGVDACYSATQKCMGAPPGLSPVTLNARAWARIQSRATPSTWYLDAKLLDAYFFQKPAAYHHTVPVNLYYALHEALHLIDAETLPTRWERHRATSELLWEQLATLNADLHPFAPAPHRLPTLNAVALPDNLHHNEAAIRARLLAEYGVEIGGGFGALKGKLWRVGLMGHGAQGQNVHTLVGALRTLLSP